MRDLSLFDMVLACAVVALLVTTIVAIKARKHFGTSRHDTPTDSEEEG